MKFIGLLRLLIIGLLLTAPVLAQGGDEVDSGDNAWILMSSALVLLMTGPGLALFYGGLVRKKNMLGTMMQCLAMMGAITVLWALVGYSLAFAPGNVFIGGFDYALLNDVGAGSERVDIPSDVHDFPVDVRDHHAGADHRRLRGENEIQRDARLHDAVGNHCLLPDGPHGLGPGRPDERLRRRGHSLPGFRRRYRRAYLVGSFGLDLCAVSGQTERLPRGRHETSQPAVELYRRLPAVGRLVRLQRRQRVGR